MDLQIKDKVVVVTGGAKGIGASIVRACTNEGALPVIVDRDTAAGQQLQDELNSRGMRSEVVPIDLLAADGCS
jgi:L-fucose dehydrogenase